MTKLRSIFILLDNGDGSSRAKYFPTDEAADAYLEKYEGDAMGGYPQEVDGDTFTVSEDGVLIPQWGFDDD